MNTTATKINSVYSGSWAGAWHSSSLGQDARSGRYNPNSSSDWSRVEINIPNSAINITKIRINMTVLADYSNPKACTCYYSTIGLEYNQVVSAFDPNYYGCSEYLLNKPSSRAYLFNGSLAGDSVKNYTKVYFELTGSDLKSGTGYLYFLRNKDCGRCNGGFWAGIDNIEVTYTEGGSEGGGSEGGGGGDPIEPSLFAPTVIENTTTIVGQSGTVRVSWSGGTTSGINKYIVYLKDRNNTQIGIQDNVSISVRSIDVVISSPMSEGQLVYATVAVCNSNKSTESSKQQVAKINYRPTKVGIEADGALIDSSHSVEYILHSEDLDNKDSIKQKLTYYYSYDDQMTWHECDSKTILTIKDIPAGDQILYFRAYDGVEYGDPDFKQVRVASIPVIDGDVSNTNIIYETVSGRTQSNTKLVKKATIRYRVSGLLTDMKVQLGYKSSPIESESEITYNDISSLGCVKKDYYNRKIEIGISEIPQDYLPYGDFFFIRIIADNNGNPSNPYTFNKEKVRRPLQPGKALINQIQSDNNENADSDYFYNKITINLTTPGLSEGAANLEKIETIIKRINNYNTEIISNIGTTNPNFTISNVMTGLSSIVPGEEVEIGTRVHDTAGQTTTFFYQGSQIDKNKRYVRTTDIKDSSVTIVPNQIQIKPLSNTSSFDFKFSPYKSTGTISIKYQYKFHIQTQLQDNVQEIIPNTTTEEQGFLKPIFSADAVNLALTRILPLSYQNEIYSDSYIEIIGTDAFGQNLKKRMPITIDYIENPYFTEAYFSLYHDYDISSKNIQVDESKKLSKIIKSQIDQTKNLNLRMFNPKEKVVLKFSKANDLNNDVQSYHLYISKQPFKEKELSKNIPTEANFDSNYINIPISSLVSLADDKYGYSWDVPNRSQNEIIFFKLIAVDSKERESEPIYSETFLIGCRAISASFDIENLTYTKEEHSQDSTVTLNFNFNLFDLGGSSMAKNTPGVFTFYDEYPNFERIFSGYNKKIALRASLDTTPTFNSENCKEVLLTGLDEFGSPISFKTFNKQQVSFVGFTKTFQKLYAKFELIISYGIDSENISELFTGLSYIVSNSYFKSFIFGKMPTMAQRQHKIGINTTTLQSQDVFVVESYSNQRYVKFKGLDEVTSQPKEIIIDLVSGKIHGATIYGGTWE